MVYSAGSDRPRLHEKDISYSKTGKNHPIQGTNADAIKYALVFLSDKIKEKNFDASIVLTVHDELFARLGKTG